MYTTSPVYRRSLDGAVFRSIFLGCSAATVILNPIYLNPGGKSKMENCCFLLYLLVQNGFHAKKLGLGRTKHPIMKKQLYLNTILNTTAAGLLLLCGCKQEPAGSESQKGDSAASSATSRFVFQIGCHFCGADQLPTGCRAPGYRRQSSTCILAPNSGWRSCRKRSPRCTASSMRSRTPGMAARGGRKGLRHH